MNGVNLALIIIARSISNYDEGSTYVLILQNEQHLN